MNADSQKWVQPGVVPIVMFRFASMFVEQRFYYEFRSASDVHYRISASRFHRRRSAFIGG